MTCRSVSPLKVKIKICCIRTHQEARLAVAAGADAIGLVSAMPSGPGVIPEKDIVSIVSGLPEEIDTFLLTSQTNSKSIIRQLQFTGASTVQLVDDVQEEVYEAIRLACPTQQIVQVVHVQDQSAIDYALKKAQWVDYLLLDSGQPHLMIKQLGGTGKTHDWTVSREIIRLSPIPVYLAGGLSHANVLEAVRYAGPFGVDVCSGVRTDDVLDPVKLKAFIRAINH